MELLFLNMSIIVFFLFWAFILICKSSGANIEDKNIAWKKYQQSRIKKLKFNEKRQKEIEKLNKKNY
ncbi:hypothetical protein [uncultured Gilliamella sp.]|uniref:hypothetical protein n=1 Tax=uncultured Gilliamella sp. TaxID=1193505 RepID=UPI0025CE7C52|nr:hypothetical protein [uncultured Gilliamella sp.]